VRERVRERGGRDYDWPRQASARARDPAAGNGDLAALSGDLLGETKRPSRIKPRRDDLSKILWAIGAPWSLG